MDQKRFAIIVGVSIYEDEISTLHYAKNDAVRVFDVLVNHGGFDPQRIHLFIEDENTIENSTFSSKPPTRSNILQAVRHIADSAQNEDLILVYFAGHGGEISKTPYLITSDTKLNVIEQTAINVNSLNEILEESEARAVIRIFDSCRNDFQIGRNLTGRMSQGLHDAFMHTASGWATISSCSTGEKAYESPEFEQGVFSYYLCEGLDGNASNDEGIVTVESLVDYIKISVMNWCETKMVKQTPHLLSDLSGPMYITQVNIKKDNVLIPDYNPLVKLRMGLDNHLKESPHDVRNLHFTSEKQTHEVSEIMFSRIDTIIQEFEHTIITIEASQKGYLHAFEGGAKGIQWQTFDGEMTRLGLKQEYKDTIAIKYSFNSSDVIVPSSDLFISTVRFSFLFWIWWFHICHPEQLENKFKPDPRFKSGFYAFKPSAALDTNKVFRTVDEVFSQSSESIVQWAQQLRDYVESRIDPMRKLGDIIS